MPSSPSTTHLLRQFVATSKRCSRSSQRNLSLLCPSTSQRSSSRSTIPHAGRRTFVTTSALRAAVAQRPKPSKAELLTYPSPSSIRDPDEDEDEDMELVPPEEATLAMTDRAAEQLRSIAQRENNPNAALRVAVESGGCHGYQYKMHLAKNREADDYHFSHPRIKPSNIYIDAVSMSLMKGSAIDFATELIGSSFRVVDNPQAKGSGCGCGVSWELNV